MLSDLAHGLTVANGGANASCLAHSLRSGRAGAQISAAAKGSSPSMQISQRDVLEIEASLPDLHIQARSAAFLDASLEEIDTRETERFIERRANRATSVWYTATVGIRRAPHPRRCRTESPGPDR